MQSATCTETEVAHLRHLLGYNPTRETLDNRRLPYPGTCWNEFKLRMYQSQQKNPSTHDRVRLGSPGLGT